jgi:hypothetical protein
MPRRTGVGIGIRLPSLSKIEVPLRCLGRSISVSLRRKAIHLVSRRAAFSTARLKIRRTQRERIKSNCLMARPLFATRCQLASARLVEGGGLSDAAGKRPGGGVASSRTGHTVCQSGRQAARLFVSAGQTAGAPRDQIRVGSAPADLLRLSWETHRIFIGSGD